MTHIAPRRAALGALGLSILAAAAATGTVTLFGWSTPAMAYGIVAAAGLVVSDLLSTRADPRWPQVNLYTSFALALLLLTTRATLAPDSAGSGIHAGAELLVILVMVRSPAVVTVAGIRSSLMLSMGAMLGAAASSALVTGWLGLWLLSALVCLVQLPAQAVPLRLTGTEPVAPATALRRQATVVAALVAVVVGAVAVVSAIDPTPQRAGARLGNPPDRSADPARYSGYRSSLDTGDRFTLSDEVVMTVDAPAPDFWRGQSFDVWDGRTWTASAVTSNRFSDEGTGFVPPGFGDQDSGGQTFVQHFRIKVPWLSLLYGAYRVDQIDSFAGRILVFGDGTIVPSRPLGAGAEYTALSIRPRITAAILRAHDPGGARIPSRLAELSTQLPATVPDRVRTLAHQLTDAQPTAYDKVRAIEAWMGANTTYTLDIAPLPPGADAVDQHLFVDRKGFCEQIATSTAVLLRSVGVAARVATGYAPGEESVLGGTFTVRAKDAHAWVEVWFPGLGWQAFDPTASVPLSGESSRSAGQRVARLLAAVLPWLALVAGLCLTGALVLVLRARHRARLAAAAAPWSTRLAATLEREGRARGRPRVPTETPLDYAWTLSHSVLPDDRVVRVGQLVSAAAYGPAGDPPEEEQAWVDEVLREISAAFPVARRRWSPRRARRGT